MHLVAVVMASPTRDIRNETAKKLLDYGFANFASYHEEMASLGTLPVRGGVRDVCPVSSREISLLMDKADAKNIVKQIDLDERLTAPVLKGEVVGEISYYVGDRKIGSSQIVADEAIDKIGFGDFFLRMLRQFFMA